MLTAEANERLTRVGAGTPMGELMRRYWLPVRPFAQLLGEEVLPVRILGEDLVLFRTPQGDLGLVGDRCPHRAAKLELGIPDDGGIRCGYHGWKFSPEGQCVDTPLEAPEATLKDRIKIPGYPVQEMGGLVWAYLGPLPAPLLPPWDLFRHAQRYPPDWNHRVELQLAPVPGKHCRPNPQRLLPRLPVQVCPGKAGEIGTAGPGPGGAYFSWSHQDGGRHRIDLWPHHPVRHGKRE